MPGATICIFSFIQPRESHQVRKFSLATPLAPCAAGSDRVISGVYILHYSPPYEGYISPLKAKFPL